MDQFTFSDKSREIYKERGIQDVSDIQLPEGKMANYYIRGPILEGYKFIIVGSNESNIKIIDSRLEGLEDVSKYPYFLRYSEEMGAYVLDPRLGRNSPISYFEVCYSKSVEEYSVVRTVGEVIIKDISTSQNKYLSSNAEGFLTRSENKWVFKLVAHINPWNVSPLLAGVNYGLLDKSNREVKIYKIFPDIGNNQDTLVNNIDIINLSNRNCGNYNEDKNDYMDREYHAYQTKFRIVPFRLLKKVFDASRKEWRCSNFKCMTDLKCAIKVRNLESNWILKNYFNMSDLQNNSRYFTNVKDCLNGNWYSYCGPNQTCGTNISDRNIVIEYFEPIEFDGSGRGTCRGPCPKGASEFCDFNTKNGVYECENISEIQTQGSFWFVIIVILLFAVFLLISLNYIE